MCLFHGQNAVYELLGYLFPGAWIEPDYICSPISYPWFFWRKSLFFLPVMKIMKMSHQFPPKPEGSHACGHVRRCLDDVQIWWLVTKISLVTLWVSTLLVRGGVVKEWTYRCSLVIIFFSSVMRSGSCLFQLTYYDHLVPQGGIFLHTGQL